MVSFGTRRRQPGRAPGSSALPDLGAAPDFRGIRPWINTSGGGPLTLAELRGRVVLIEFWTFACGNCIRTLPFLRQMHHRYGPELAVVGVHTPELPFERHAGEVAQAVQERGLMFPIGLDNDFATWQAYGTGYWPSLYLVDGVGRIRYTHVGEGRYRRTESAIRDLLAESAALRESNGAALAITRQPGQTRRRGESPGTAPAESASRATPSNGHRPQRNGGEHDE